MACINVIAAETDEEAHRLATSLYNSFLNVIRGTAFPLKPPVENMDELWNEAEELAVRSMLRYAFIGSAATVKAQLDSFLQATGVDELMITTHVFDHAARLRSYEIVSDITNKADEENSVLAKSLH
jgi:alkanesulfonate monooxygenase SsuD/methylene tetrahydromethanopterin reductase-like flavin-dependent oxidoreductase (luciferase family)